MCRLCNKPSMPFNYFCRDKDRTYNRKIRIEITELPYQLNVETEDIYYSDGHIENCGPISIPIRFCPNCGERLGEKPA